MLDFQFSTVPADDLAPGSARSSAGTVIKKIGCRTCADAFKQRGGGATLIMCLQFSPSRMNHEGSNYSRWWKSKSRLTKTVHSELSKPIVAFIAYYPKNQPRYAIRFPVHLEETTKHLRIYPDKQTVCIYLLEDSILLWQSEWYFVYNVMYTFLGVIVLYKTIFLCL